MRLSVSLEFAAAGEDSAAQDLTAAESAAAPVRRMDEAALMLESGDDAIARIATRVGYETTTAFSKAFKQHYSFSPGRYRARSGTGPQSSPHLHVSA